MLETHTDEARGPLCGTLVTDLTRALAGPHAAMMLADLGADVIKIETPHGGDDTRGWGPPFVGSGIDGERQSTYFLSANRNKKSVTLDLKSDTGRATLEALIRRSDVLLENFRAGALGRLGFSDKRLAELNPRLVVLSITGFGHDGPDSDRAGYDQIAQGEAGLMSLTGATADEPQKVGVPIADLLAGMYGAFGVLAALHERGRTGRGQIVRTSLLAGIVGVHGFQGTKWTVGGEVGRADGNFHPSICPYGLFPCADGAVQIAVGSESLWQRFVTGFRLDETAGMCTNPQRVENRKAVNEMVEAAFRDCTVEELLTRLADLGVPAGRIRAIDEVYAWEQTRSQGLVIEVEHATLGRVTLPGPPLRFFDTKGEETTRTLHSAPPALGADNEAVRNWLQGTAQ